jgi:hypothetical protein
MQLSAKNVTKLMSYEIYMLLDLVFSLELLGRMPHTFPGVIILLAPPWHLI